MTYIIKYIELDGSQGYATADNVADRDRLIDEITREGISYSSLNIEAVYPDNDED